MRNISVPVYLAALAITIAIFGIGVYVGSAIDRGNLDSIASQVGQANQLALSSQLMLLYGDSQSFCPVYRDNLQKLDSATEQLGLQLTYMEDIKGVSDPALKKQYFELETNAFLLSEKVKQKCGGNYATVLYFYSNSNCTDCTQQGYELISLKQKMGETLRVYSFDGSIGSPVADALKSLYNVGGYPALVINGDNATMGFKNSSTVRSRIG
jgi:hypothetical protein